MSSSVAAVVITNRDYGRYLGEAIASAIEQGDAVQVIVVDDGSTDDSLTVVAGHHPRVTLIRCRGDGQGAAMGAAMAEVDAPIVVFLDADDRLAPGLLDRVVPLFADRSVARVHYPLRRINSLSAPTGGTVPAVISALPAGDLRGAISARPDDMAWQPTSGNAYRRTVLDAILPLPAQEYRISADHYLNALSGLHGRIERLETVGGDYRIHGANADARLEFDLARIQQIVARSVVTQRAVVDECRRLGLVSLPMGRSISFQVNRLVSLRLGAGDHPIDADGRRRAWRDAVRACRARSDLGPLRRVAGIGFVTTVAFGPRRTLPRLVTSMVSGSTDVGRRR